MTSIVLRLAGFVRDGFENSLADSRRVATRLMLRDRKAEEGALR